MITLYRELSKIIRQLCASQNIFGYRSMVASQLFLLYCFSGKIYFTDKIHHHVKYFWYGVNTCQLVFAYTMAVDYLWYGSKYDLVMIFNVVNALGLIHIGALGFPFVLHLYGNRVETMIELVDKILTAEADSAGFKQQKVMTDVKKIFASFLIPFCLSFAVYVFACILDMMLFFEQHKAANYFYYAFPPPLIQRFSNLYGWFYAVEWLTSLLFMIMMFEGWLVFSLMLYLCIICCNELTTIRGYLNARTRDLNKGIEEGQFLDNWNATFEGALEHSIKEFQTASRLINYLGDLVEAYGTISIIAAFCYGVALLYVCCSGDLPFVLKVKCSIGYMCTGITVFLFYWIGQSLNNLVSEVSLAVYATPWYESVKVRQNVYVMLCQTQSTKTFVIFKVYGLLLNNFSRYLHGLVSYTNILLKLTNK